MKKQLLFIALLIGLAGANTPCDAGFSIGIGYGPGWYGPGWGYGPGYGYGPYGYPYGPYGYAPAYGYRRRYEGETRVDISGTGRESNRAPRRRSPGRNYTIQKERRSRGD